MACVPLRHAVRRAAQLHDDGAVRRLLAQAWNILGGFGGQFSFGHALFFGTGAYVQAIAQLQGGLNPWVALPLRRGRRGAWSALFVGALTLPLRPARARTSRW